MRRLRCRLFGHRWNRILANSRLVSARVFLCPRCWDTVTVPNDDLVQL